MGCISSYSGPFGLKIHRNVIAERGDSTTQIRNIPDHLDTLYTVYNILSLGDVDAAGNGSRNCEVRWGWGRGGWADGG